MNKFTVVFLAFFSFILVGCQVSAPPFFGSSASMTYESHSEKGDLDIGATTSGQWSSESKPDNAYNVVNSLYARYQFGKHGFAGLGYERGYLRSKKIFTDLGGIGGNDLAFGTVGIQHSFNAFYTRNSLQYGYGKLGTLAVIESQSQGVVRAGIHRTMFKSLIGGKWKFFEGNIGVRYFYNRFFNVKGDMVYEGVNYVDKINNNKGIHFVAPELSIAYTYHNVSFFCQIAGRNLIPNNYKFFYDNEEYISFGLNIKVNALEQYKKK